MNSKRGTETNKDDAEIKQEPNGFHDLTDRERLAIVTAGDFMANTPVDFLLRSVEVFPTRPAVAWRWSR